MLFARIAMTNVLLAVALALPATLREEREEVDDPFRTLSLHKEGISAVGAGATTTGVMAYLEVGLEMSTLVSMPASILVGLVVGGVIYIALNYAEHHAAAVGEFEQKIMELADQTGKTISGSVKVDDRQLNDLWNRLKNAHL